MKSHINSTGRKKISHELLVFTLNRDAEGRPLSFEADLSGLSTLGLPPDASVIVEPFVNSSSMRFEFGTVGALLQPGDRRLDDLDRDAGDVLFRVKVIDRADASLGRLLAAADRLPEATHEEPSERFKPLLPVKAVPLGERLWCVQITGGDRPLLCLNSRVPHLADELRRSSLFRSAVLPEAFREVVRAMLESSPADVPWYEDWRSFLTITLGQQDPEESVDEDSHEEYLDAVTNALTEKWRFASTLLPPLEPEVLVD